MKQTAAAVVLVLLLTGCSLSGNELDRGLSLRSRLLEGESCHFDAVVTADYGDKLYEFSMRCQADPEGNLSFTVLEPESISGITGRITRQTGQLTFDDVVLTFPLLADGQLSPVSAPWIFLNTLRSGYLTSAGMEGELLRLRLDDSYREDALHLDIWLNTEDTPVRGEIFFRERKILSVEVTNFEIG